MNIPTTDPRHIAYISYVVHPNNKTVVFVTHLNAGFCRLERVSC